MPKRRLRRTDKLVLVARGTRRTDMASITKPARPSPLTFAELRVACRLASIAGV